MKLKRKAGAQGEGLWGPQVPLASHTGTQRGVSRDPFPQIKLWGFLCGSYVKGFSLFFLSLRPLCKTSCYCVVLSSFCSHWSEDKCSVSDSPAAGVTWTSSIPSSSGPCTSLQAPSSLPSPAPLLAFSCSCSRPFIRKGRLIVWVMLGHGRMG